MIDNSLHEQLAQTQRLYRERDEFAQSLVEDVKQLSYERAQAGKRAIKLEAELQALREALKPFCDYLEAMYANNDFDSEYYEAWQVIKALLEQGVGEEIVNET